jgi:ABC-type sugar transport system permease subunit
VQENLGPALDWRSPETEVSKPMALGTAGRGGRERVRLFWSVLLLAPAMVYLAVFQIFPVFYAFWISFQTYDMLSPPVFAGLKNYFDAFHDKEFLRSCWITATYVIYTIVPVIILSFFLAQILAGITRGRSTWRLLIFLPSILPLVSVALVWRLLMSYNGPVNSALDLFNIDPRPWLTSSAYAPWALIIMSWWHATSYYTIMFLAGFLSLPRECYEAAYLDGARGWSLLRHVTLPLMRPTVVLVVVMATVNGLKAFVFQKVMTDGGPADSTEILTMLIYKTAFSYLNMGRASAYSIILFAAILAISLAQIWLIGERSDREKR